MVNFHLLFTCTVCFSLFLFSNSTFTTTATELSGNASHDVVDKISQEILAIRQEINNAINNSKPPPPINFTLLQNSFKHLHQVILEKINQSSTLVLISYNDTKMLTENILMTINLVIDRVPLDVYSTEEQSVILTSILAIYKDWSRIVGSHLKSFKPSKLNLFMTTTYVKMYSQQFIPKNAQAALFTFWNNQAKQKVVGLQLPIAGIASADREENVTVTIVVSFIPKNVSFLNVQSPLISITIDNQSHVVLANGHQFNFTAYNLTSEDADYFNCAFWSTNAWSTSGCNRIVRMSTDDTGDSSTSVSCECDHLSDFAIIRNDEVQSPSTPATTTTTTITTTTPAATASDHYLTTDRPTSETITSRITTTTTTTTITTTNNTTTNTTITTPKIPSPTLPPKTTISTSASTIATTTETISSEIDQTVDQIDSLLGNLTSNSSESIDQETWLGSLDRISQLVESVVQDEDLVSQINNSMAIYLTNSSLGVLNCLIESVKIWEELPLSSRHSSASVIFKTIDSLAALINLKRISETRFHFESVELHTKSFSQETDEHISFQFDDVVHLSLPFEGLLPDLRSNPNISATAAVLKRFPSYLSASGGNDQLQVNSHAVSIKVENEEYISLGNGSKLQLVTKNLHRLQFRDAPRCTFWSFTTANLSTTGCTFNRRESNRSSTVCECDHLTDFLTLVDITNREVPTVARSVLTYICSGISCLFLVFTLYIAIRYNREHFTLQEDQFNVKSNRYYLSLSIAIWLLISHFLIMFGLDRTEVQFICDLNSLVLLFALLTTFSFMLMFSLHLYIITSKSHLFRYFPFKYFAIFGYAFPLAVIFVSFILIYALETKSFSGLMNSLSGEYFCWLSSQKYPYHIWVFLGPVTIITVINMYILVTIIYKIVKSCRQKTNSKRMYSNLFTAYILLFNFGIPWLLYVFYINEQLATVFAYIFIVVNGTQGIALFAEQYILYRMKLKRLVLRNGSDTSKITILSTRSQ